MKKGFTLLELLLVVSILSASILVFVSYNTGGDDDVAVDAAAWKIQSDIRHAQHLATLTGRAHGVEFQAGGIYIVYSGNTQTPVLNPLDQRPMIESMSQFGNVFISKIYSVEFDSQGMPTIGGGGGVEVKSGAGASRRIRVTADTGAAIVDVLEYGRGCSLLRSS